MSNSTIRVTETSANDSLILVIGENGMITPDKATVQEYLKSRGETELKIMQVNSSDGHIMDVTVDHMTYIAAQREEVMYVKSQEELEQIAKSLLNFRLDHDYTPFIHSPSPDLQDLDEFDQTLSLFDGSSEIVQSPPELVPIKTISSPTVTPSNISKVPPTLTNPVPIVKETKTPTAIIQTIPKLTQKAPVKVKPIKPALPIKINDPPKHTELPKIVLPKPTPPKVAVIKRVPPKVILPKPIQLKKPVKEIIEVQAKTELKGDGVDEDAYSDDDFTIDSDESVDDANDLDFEIDEMPKTRARSMRKSRAKAQLEPPKPKTDTIVAAKQKEVTMLNVEEATPQTPSEVPVEKPPDKKPPLKKEKKMQKPIPNDFMLFATPDIIRRVGGKQDPTTPSTPTPTTPPVVEVAPIIKPASITQSISKPESVNSDTKEKRLGTEKPPRTSIETKSKDQRLSAELRGQKSVEKVDKSDRRSSLDKRRTIYKGSGDSTTSSLESIPSARDVRAIIQSENTRTFTTNLVIPETGSQSSNLGKSEDEEDLNLSIDNINELLYKVAETLADDKEFQSALDQSLDEDLVQLDPLQHDPLSSTYNTSNQVPQANLPHKGTQVVRSDGRVVVIPPLERPTTRSRNKAKPEPVLIQQTTGKIVSKVLDDEPISEGELDSSSDEDQSEDDPRKLWCICNQPHNNRFMICCDSCEEWYHGKCVNVTKQMGQMMEKDGKEWICLYCKDLTLKRPAAAARRIRKASRTSTTGSVDHSDSNMENPLSPPPYTIPKLHGCIVCGKSCRNSSIYCSDACIVQNAKDVEKVVVFDRSSGKLLSGIEAPTAANLGKWLKKHPGFEVVRSKANITKNILTTEKIPAKLQVVKDPLHQDVSLALQKRGVHVGLLKHSPKETAPTKALYIQHKEMPVQLKPVQKSLVEQKLIIKKPPQVKATQLMLNPGPAPPASIKRKAIQKSISVENQHSPPVKHKIIKLKPMVEPVSQPISPEKKQESVRDNVKKSLCEQLMHRIQAQNEIKLQKNDVVKISSEIESQLFKCFGDTGQKYRNKYRSLMFNIKDQKNQTLWRSICQKSVNPYQLVRLSPDDLASQELALWREKENKHQLEMITKNELDQLGRPKQFVIKTHKGEQEVEDDHLSTLIDKTETVTGTGLAIESALPDSPDKKVKEKDKQRSRSNRNKKHDNKSSRERDKSDRKDHKRDKHSSTREKNQRRRSRSRSRGGARRSEKRRSRSRDRYRRSHKTSRHKKSPPHITTDKLDKKSKEILETLVDNKIVPPLEDKLWKHVTQEDITTVPAESDSDHEPTSTVTIPTPPHANDHDDLNSSLPTSSALNNTEDDEGGLSPPPKCNDVVWSGTINMVDVAEITITAHEVSGDCYGLGEELPMCLDVVGRISPDTVWDYISKMKSSNSKAIALLRLNSTTVEAQMPYIALYSYLQSRNRLGVVKSYNKAIKDFYILPLASHQPIPQALLPLSGPSFEEFRPVLLLGVIVRDKRKRPLFNTSTPREVKRFKIDTPLITPIVQVTPRSYTPPPNTDPVSKSMPSTKYLVANSPKEQAEEDMDEPYSPKDSDPDTLTANGEDKSRSTAQLSSSNLSNILTGPAKMGSFLETNFIEPFTNKFDTIPGLDVNPGLLANQQLQHEMEVLDQQIAKQKAEIQNMSQNITSATQPGTTLSNIELPSNIQQILDSIKTSQNTNTAENPTSASSSSKLTIPLILPKINARNSSSSSPPTIPMKLSRFKNLSSSKNSPVPEALYDSYNKQGVERSVLSSFSDDELIRKANEMMQTVEEQIGPTPLFMPPLPGSLATAYNIAPPLPTRSSTGRIELNQPPIPGLD